jgi:hypothetical protein
MKKSWKILLKTFTPSCLSILQETLEAIDTTTTVPMKILQAFSRRQVFRSFCQESKSSKSLDEFRKELNFTTKPGNDGPTTDFEFQSISRTS